jgi:hypothetical protein
LASLVHGWRDTPRQHRYQRRRYQNPHVVASLVWRDCSIFGLKISQAVTFSNASSKLKIDE